MHSSLDQELHEPVVCCSSAFALRKIASSHNKLNNVLCESVDCMVWLNVAKSHLLCWLGPLVPLPSATVARMRESTKTIDTKGRAVQKIIMIRKTPDTWTLRQTH